VTGLLDGLEQEGYVERDSHPSDRRALMIKLTPEGQAFLSLISFQDQTQLTELMNALSEDDRQKVSEFLARFSQFFKD
jgi:DNA-binding MarR family transcriptional regulator